VSDVRVQIILSKDSLETIDFYKESPQNAQRKHKREATPVMVATQVNAPANQTIRQSCRLLLSRVKLKEALDHSIQCVMIKFEKVLWCSCVPLPTGSLIVKLH